MIVLYPELKKKDDENYFQYVWRVDCLIREGKYKNWDEVLPIVNSELYDDEALYKGECAYRKPCKAARDFYENNVFSSSNVDELVKMKDEIRKEKVTPRGRPALVNPIKRGIDEQEQNGVTVPSRAAIIFAVIP